VKTDRELYYYNNYIRLFHYIDYMIFVTNIHSSHKPSPFGIRRGKERFLFLISFHSPFLAFFRSPFAFSFFFSRMKIRFIYTFYLYKRNKLLPLFSFCLPFFIIKKQSSFLRKKKTNKQKQIKCLQNHIFKALVPLFVSYFFLHARHPVTDINTKAVTNNVP
jgi:hypothetical protein